MRLKCLVMYLAVVLALLALVGCYGLFGPGVPTYKLLIVGPSSASVDEEVTFKVQVGPGAGPFVSFGWDFNASDGVIPEEAEGQEVTHRFSQEGDYIVAVVGTKSDGSQEVATKNVAVREPSVLSPSVAVLLHGFNGEPSQMVDIEKKIKASGKYDYVHNIKLDPLMGLPWDGPDPNADRVRSYLVDRGLQDYNIYFVCHSMGGLIARRYITRWGGSNIKKCIMIGTPNGGVNYQVFFGVAVGWLSSTGFPDRFNKPNKCDPQVTYHLIVGKRYESWPGGPWSEGWPNDGVVGAWSVTRIKDNDEYRNGATVTDWWIKEEHTAMLHNSSVIDKVLEYLGAK